MSQTKDHWAEAVNPAVTYQMEVNGVDGSRLATSLGSKDVLVRTQVRNALECHEHVQI
jgi:hypothetical protein